MRRPHARQAGLGSIGGTVLCLAGVCCSWIVNRPRRQGEFGLRTAFRVPTKRGRFAGEHLPGAGNGVALIVQQALNAERHLHISPAIESLPGTTFIGLQLWELGLPEAQHVGLDAAQVSDLADAEVELVRDRVRDGAGRRCLLRHRLR